MVCFVFLIITFKVSPFSIYKSQKNIFQEICLISV